MYRVRSQTQSGRQWDDPLVNLMEPKIIALNTANKPHLDPSPESHSTIDVLHEPFLNFCAIFNPPIDYSSRVYCSLVSLVKEEYPFDDALQDRATKFLKSLEPIWNTPEEKADQLVTDLVPSSTGSILGFIESILTLLSSSYSTVVAAALSFLSRTTLNSSSNIRYQLVESDLIINVLATVQPLTLPILGNERIIRILTKLIEHHLCLTFSTWLSDHGITTAADQSNQREMIFQKVVAPSSQFVMFLITNWRILHGGLFKSFTILLSQLIGICPYNHSTLEFVLASPISMAFSSCLSFIENDYSLIRTIGLFHSSLHEWNEQGSEIAQSRKRMIQALLSKSFEDIVEQVMLHYEDGYHGSDLVEYCSSISKLLGSNVARL
ncbi:hypothetical protein BLNAU_4345 [Blattamonas nauphoetae]|uniref:Uncharacterized protein n=1 Tax=Blattamonas nauphoetae TaxID=2049346 RepID=A0ABQ9YAF2_9EUKA|nr:hypothetical protein BLNAU_4345 [Blattamonas nauphoetae]